MTLFDVVNEPSDPDQPAEQVRVLDTHIGKGVFAIRPYPETAVIGQITGRTIADEHYGSEYTFELKEGRQLEPDGPFKYVNHCCDPNCEFDLLEEPQIGDEPNQKNLYLIALQDIWPGEQLTIDYNWPATSAIACKCGSKYCRGWVVSRGELDNVGETLVFSKELELETSDSLVGNRQQVEEKL